MNPELLVAGTQLISLIAQANQLYAAGQLTPEQLKTEWAAAVASVTDANRAWDAAGKPRTPGEHSDGA